MSARNRPLRRGQPVMALALLLAFWVGARGIVWASAQPEGTPAGEPVVAAAKPEAPVRAGTGGAQPSPDRRAGSDLPAVAAPPPAPVPHFVPVAPPVWPAPGEAADPSAQPQPLPAPLAATPPAAPVSPRIAGGHQMLWMAALSQLPMPNLAPAEAALPPLARKAAPQPRWSADAWLMLRRGGNGFNLPGAGLPGVNLPSGAYGASQAGAVIRFHLAPSSPLRSALYLRATTALHAPRGEELAAGLALRPLVRVPVAAMVEGRVTRTLTGDVVRPAAALVSEFPPLKLPLGLRAEVYVQGGYVGGRGATAFADGQARVERKLIGADRWELRAGAGSWGGAQKGAKRLDIGPTATLALPLGSANGRLSADWRFRVAGNAAPTSGPAITLSAGF